MRTRLSQILKFTSGWLAVPVLAVLFLLRPIFRVELCIVGAQRFGHLALEPEVFLGLRRIQTEAVGVRTIQLWSFGRPYMQSNRYLATAWKKAVRLSPGSLVGALDRGGWLFPSLALRRVPLSVFGNQNVLDRVGSVLVKFVDGTSASTLSALGLSPKSPYVCLTVRDGAYYSRTGTVESDGYRLLNFDVSVFTMAANALTAAGYAVIRVGTPTDNKVPSDSKIIDYANSELRSEQADLALIRDCAFMISTQTGPDALALALRRPVMYVDTLRISQFFLGTKLATWNPVKFVSRSTGQQLCLEELFASNLIWMKHPDDFLHSDFDFIRSSAEEIAEMVSGYLLDRQGVAPIAWQSLRHATNSRMTQLLGERGQLIWGDVTAALNGRWLERNQQWFLRKLRD